ncbi:MULTISPECIES: hypothetical protein [unclassified Pseudomonas]|uniref:hypothetical protein n=1 Tax=unclassified Pseudomonas TaxID=196821 RepID=UPI0024489221|nr:MULTISPECIES: hypothetical protein [unclassified Pseudomonas]MDH0304426.1 hypothetical protein [Pseudomonas sp. GD04091]MDH1987712.1 hypothetical protein [Pseudomonas sp. GD03689]
MDKNRGAVVGSSLVAFLPGITAQQRSAVQLAALGAEYATRMDYDAGLVTDWFSYYRRKLQFYGWDAWTADRELWPQPDRGRVVDAALRRIDATAGERYSTVIGLAMGGLAENDWALFNFERRARERRVFQLLPCAPSKPGYVDLVLYHEACDVEQMTTGFLYRRRKATRIQAELVRFNTQNFDGTHRGAVEQQLEKIARQQILSLQI